MRLWLRKCNPGPGRIYFRSYRKKNFFVGVNGLSSSKQFAMAESTLQIFPMKDTLGSWQLSMRTLTKKINLVVLKEAHFGYGRWSYVHRASAKFSPMNSYWKSNHKKNFQRSPSSKMRIVELEADWWKQQLVLMKNLVFFSYKLHQVLLTEKLVHWGLGWKSQVGSFAHMRFGIWKTTKWKCKIDWNFSANQNLAASNKIWIILSRKLLEK